ncbi:MAG TPA: glycerophosphodiester phosphodiesterase [Desulfocapsa sulfexigens]|nr:glycerophosphodiester phosphodiesterase [Desulfocapsa sulfexigens]
MRSFFHFFLHCNTLLVLLAFICSPNSAAAKLVIAQGGASGYIMEHNLPSLAVAAAMNADIIKLDVVMTADNEIIVLGSTDIAQASNVSEIFPDRAREDGQYYAIDFTLDEIRQLTLVDPAGRFPAELQPRLTIPTLEESLGLLKALDSSIGRKKTIGIAIEIKRPWFHRREGKDISKPVLGILQRYNYTTNDDNVFLLSYDPLELRRIGKKLLPEMHMSIKLVQLIESNEGQENMVEEWGQWHSYNYDWMFSNSGLRSMAGTVAAIALPKFMLADSHGKLLLESFVENSHQLGLMLFTYPVQKDDTARVPFVRSFEEELGFFYFTAGIDGIITDFCGDAVEYLKNLHDTPAVQPKQDKSVPPSVEMIINDPLQLTNPTELELKE